MWKVRLAVDVEDVGAKVRADYGTTQAVENRQQMVDGGSMRWM